MSTSNKEVENNMASEIKWEEDFDDKFLIEEGIRKREIDVDIRADVVKRLISNLLLEQRKELAGKVRGEKTTGQDDRARYWNTALEQAASLIEKE